ncbi:MAG: hypothetical protein V9G14_00520 [Cypionkella sp.]
MAYDLFQPVARHFAIVKMYCAILKDLIGFVSFSGNDDDIAGFRRQSGLFRSPFDDPSSV